MGEKYGDRNVILNTRNLDQQAVVFMKKIIEEKGWVTELSGTPEAWSPRVWPPDAEAADALKAYLDEGGEKGFYGIGVDFKGSDLTGFSPHECWVTWADFTDCVLEDGDLSGAQATDALFAGAKLARAELSKAVLSRSTFDRADLASANMIRVEARNTSFVGAKLTDAVLIDADLHEADLSSADLTRCNLNWAAFDNAVLAGSTVAGASGTVHGAVVVEVSPERRTLDGSRLEQWFAERGASVKVQSSAPR